MATAALTMVYDDPDLLKIWVDYYSKYMDRERMFVVTHGKQDYVHDIAKGCTIIPVHRRSPYPRMDADRWFFLSDISSSLTWMFDTVICNDVDELLVVDPDVSDDPIKYIEEKKDLKVITPFAVEIIHRWTEEHDLDHTRPILNQRKYVRSNNWYCKPCIVRERVQWVPDGHGIMHQPNLHLDPHLYLFHLKWMDRQFHIDRFDRRFNMRNDHEGDEEIVFGGSTWNKSRATYMMIADKMEEIRIEAFGETGFDFAKARKSYIDNYKGGENGGYKSLLNVGSDLRVIPERFIGIF
ncbi:hypothetical protein [Aliiroseovarius sp. S253]|uniref:hypothetical protein n=1 Tax=Aliiroseovarius sp. S253 TaxID=3415133 RepID=UPI003C7D4075